MLAGELPTSGSDHHVTSLARVICRLGPRAAGPASVVFPFLYVAF